MLATFEENKAPFFSLAFEECCIFLRGSALRRSNRLTRVLAVSSHGSWTAQRVSTIYYNSIVHRSSSGDLLLAIPAS